MVAPTRVKGGKSSLMERAAGPFPNHDIELVILHRRDTSISSTIGAQTMNLIDKKHIARLQIGHERSDIARLSPAPGHW